jgi:hypothetical protein
MLLRFFYSKFITQRNVFELFSALLLACDLKDFTHTETKKIPNKCPA